MIVLNYLLNGPAYETKALANKTSPTIIPTSFLSVIIPLLHLIFSLAKALTNL